MLVILLPIFVAVLALSLAHANWRIYQEARERVRQSEEHLAIVYAADLDRAGRRYAVERRPGEADDVYRRRVAHARARTFAL